MQNQPLFYSLIEFHEVPWQKNWELPVFCFSLLLACTRGIIMFMKTRKKTAIPHSYHISQTDPPALSHYLHAPSSYIKSGQTLLRKGGKKPSKARGSQHLEAKTGKFRFGSPVFQDAVHPPFPSAVLLCLGVRCEPLQKRGLGFLSPLQTAPGKMLVPLPSTCTGGGKQMGIFVCTAVCLCFYFWLTS